MDPRENRPVGGRVADHDREMLDPAVARAKGDDPRPFGIGERHLRLGDASERTGDRRLIGEDMPGLEDERMMARRGPGESGGVEGDDDGRRKKAGELGEIDRGGLGATRLDRDGAKTALGHGRDRLRVGEIAQLGRGDVRREGDPHRAGGTARRPGETKRGGPAPREDKGRALARGRGEAGQARRRDRLRRFGQEGALLVAERDDPPRRRSVIARSMSTSAAGGTVTAEIRFKPCISLATLSRAASPGGDRARTNR